MSANRAALMLVGHRSGRLLVTSKAESKHGQSRWNCICDCGRTCLAYGSSVAKGETQSCGCLKSENARVNGRSKKVDDETRKGWKTTYRVRNLDRIRIRGAALMRKRSQIERAELRDAYVKRVLAESIGLSRGLIPQSLVDLKREHLRLVRELKEKKA